MRYPGDGSISVCSSAVHNQLAAQKVFFPAANGQAITSLPTDDAAEMKKYAGQQMTNGAQAKTYADHSSRCT